MMFAREARTLSQRCKIGGRTAKETERNNNAKSQEKCYALILQRFQLPIFKLRVLFPIFICVDPSHFQDSWRLSDGFVAAEAKVILPHRARSRYLTITHPSRIHIFASL